MASNSGSGAGVGVCRMVSSKWSYLTPKIDEQDAALRLLSLSPKFSPITLSGKPLHVPPPLTLDGGSALEKKSPRIGPARGMFQPPKKTETLIEMSPMIGGMPGPSSEEVFRAQRFRSAEVTSAHALLEWSIELSKMKKKRKKQKKEKKPKIPKKKKKKSVATSKKAKPVKVKKSRQSEGSGSKRKKLVTPIQRGSLPYNLPLKYVLTYNKHGRVGIYSPDERADILKRYHDKRRRRSWTKTIRYNCRKKLAEKRYRVAGRFVKRGFAPPPPPSMEKKVTASDIVAPKDADSAV